MAYITGTVGATPMTNLADVISSAVVGQGWVLVETTVQNTITWRVYRVPTTVSGVQSDWYFLFGFNTAAQTNPMLFTMSEGWDTNTKQMSRFIPINTNGNSASVASQSDDTAIGSSIPQNTPNLSTGTNGLPASISQAAPASGGPYFISATGSRLVVGWRTAAATDAAMYAGALNSYLPAAVDPMPICLHSPTINNNSNLGGTTREPGIFSSGFPKTIADLPWRGYSTGYGFSTYSLYNNKGPVGIKPEWLSLLNNSINPSRSPRGTFKDMLYVPVGTTSVNGDTLNVAANADFPTGATFTKVGAQSGNQNGNFWVNQAA